MKFSIMLKIYYKSFRKLKFNYLSTAYKSLVMGSKGRCFNSFYNDLIRKSVHLNLNSLKSPEI